MVAEQCRSRHVEWRQDLRDLQDFFDVLGLWWLSSAEVAMLNGDRIYGIYRIFFDVLGLWWLSSAEVAMLNGDRIYGIYRIFLLGNLCGMIQDSLSEQIIASAFEVHNVLGSDFLEPRTGMNEAYASLILSILFILSGLHR
jgi:hypothetical protein